MKKIKKRSTVLAINAMFLALTIIFVFVPLPGLVTSSVLMLLPTIVLSQLLGLKSGLFQSFMLGLLLFIKGFGYITTPTDVTLQNPLISIFPRLFVALVTVGISTLGNKVLKFIKLKEENNEQEIKKFKIKKTAVEYFFSTLASFLGALTNAILVLGMFYAFYKGNKELIGSEITFKFIYTIFIGVSGFEMLTTLLVAPPIVIASRKALKKIMEKE